MKFAYPKENFLKENGKIVLILVTATIVYVRRNMALTTFTLTELSKRLCQLYHHGDHPIQNLSRNCQTKSFFFCHHDSHLDQILRRSPVN